MLAFIDCHHAVSDLFTMDEVVEKMNICKDNQCRNLTSDSEQNDYLFSDETVNLVFTVSGLVSLVSLFIVFIVYLGTGFKKRQIETPSQTLVTVFKSDKVVFRSESFSRSRTCLLVCRSTTKLATPC